MSKTTSTASSVPSKSATDAVTSSKPSITTSQNVAAKEGLFGKANYVWIAAGIVLILIGFLLMLGGRSNDPHVFDPNQVYSFRRVTLAPIVIVLGIVCEVVGIMKKTGYERAVK